MENHSSMTGWKELFSHTNLSNFRRPLQLLLGTLSTRTGEEEDALPEVKSRISIAVRMRRGCIIPSCPLLRPEVGF